MDSLELDTDVFYICTELSPRCYVVQKAIQIDKSQIERMVGELEKNSGGAAGAHTLAYHANAPPAPPLPYWFTRECKEKLLKCESPAQSIAAGTAGSGATTSASMAHYAAAGPSKSPMPPPLLHTVPIPDLKQQLKAQLEYYFSRENLITDRYLRCQMDSEQYVPITVIAGFRKITQLTNDYNLILQVLRESSQVEVDENGEKVRPITRRCTIILREIAEQHKDELEKMLAGGPPYLDLKYGLNDSWYVLYESEEITQNAFLHLQSLNTTINNKSICARIKAGGPPCDPAKTATTELRSPGSQSQEPPSDMQVFSNILDLGPVLASYGYTPRATYCPGSTVVHVEEDVRTPVQGRHAFRANINTNHAHQNGKPNSSSRYYGMQNGHVPQAYHPIHPANASTSAATFDSRRYGGGSGNGNGGASGGSREHQRSGAPTTNGGYKRNGVNNGGGRRNGGNTYYNDGRRWTYDNEAAPPPNSNTWNGYRDAWTNNQPIPATLPNRSRASTTADDDLGNVTPTPQDVQDGVSSEGASTVDSDATNRKRSSHSTSSAYSFEEQAFPSLTDQKPEPTKPAEKLSFSFVAAGKRNQKPEVKKSYADKLKEKSLKSS